jgi:methylenetetrahydrofolate reductase (NADPH)
MLKDIAKLNEGFDMSGGELKGAPDFLAGAVVNPGADTEAALELQIIKMKKKIAAGAKFFQTQAVYDIDLFEKFIRRVEGFKIPIIGGVILLKSAGMARFMNKNVAGVFVPNPLIKEITDTKDKVKKSVEIAARIVKRLKNLCQGIHIMALGWEKMIPAVLDQADI